MKITSVNVRKVEKEGSRMKGIASVLLDDCFAIHDIRIIEGDKGLFIAMPSRQTATGGYRELILLLKKYVQCLKKKFLMHIIKKTKKTT